MRRRLNGRLLLTLIVASVLLAVGVYGLHRVQIKRSARGLLVQADLAEKRGDLDMTEEFLRRYLAIRPNDLNTLIRYGRIREDRAATPEMFAQVALIYERVLRRDAARDDIRRRLVNLTIRLGDYSDARPLLETLLTSSPDDSELTFLLGRCEEETRRTDKAIVLYEKSRSLDRARVEAYVRLANLLPKDLGSRAKADRIIEELVANNPRSTQALLARAAYRKQHALPDAANDIASALALAPDDAEVLLAAAGADKDPAHVDRVRGYLRHGVELYPRRVEFYQALADLEARAGHPDEAVSWLERGAKVDSKGAALHWILGDLLIELGRTDEASRIVEELKQENVRRELRDFLTARIAMSRGAWLQAAGSFEAIEPALGQRADTRLLAKRAALMRGECYDRLGDANKRSMALRQAVSIDLDPDPFWAHARLKLAAALLSLNRIGEAIEQYRIVTPRDRTAAAGWVRLQIYQNLRRPAAERQWQSVEQTLDQMEQTAPDSPEIALLRAESLAARDQVGPARDLLKKALTKHPRQFELWEALAQIADREGKHDAALSILNDAKRQAGDTIGLRLALAAHWARVGGDRAANALAELEQGIDKYSRDERGQLWSSLARVYTAIGRDKSAQALWGRLAEQQPDDLVARLYLFDFALRTGDETAAKAQLAEIKRIAGEEGALWHFGQAALLTARYRKTPSDKSLLLETRGHLEKASSARPTWSRIPLAEAELDMLAGQPDHALKNFLHAIMELGDRNPGAIRQTVQLLNERQQFDKAALVLRTLEKEGIPLSGELQRLAANISYQSHDYGQALQLAEKSVSPESTQYRDLIWLGQLRSAAKQPAEPLFRRAVTLAPNAPEAWIALVSELAQAGQTAKAEAATHDAERALSKEQAPLALAQCYELIGRQDQATEQYKKALAARPNDPTTLRNAAAFSLRTRRFADAQTYLQRIVELPAKTEDTAWARRTLATLLAMGGDREKTLKALDLLGVSDTRQTESPNDQAAPDDLRAQARVLAMQPRLKERQQAIEILRGLSKRDLALPEDQFLLVQLLDLAGDQREARPLLAKLVDTQAKNPTYLAYNVRFQLRHGRVNDALLALTRLEQLPGIAEQPGAIELKARVLHAQAHDDEVVSLLNAWAQRDPLQLPACAALLDELGQPAAAEEAYRRLVSQSKRPESVLVLARFLGRHGKPQEALGLCDRAWKTCPSELVSNTSLIILYSAGSSPELQQGVETRLTEAIAKEPSKDSLRFDLANLRSLQLRFDDAESILREIHERNKRNWAPLNNLAWLLALQPEKKEQALSIINQAIDLGGERPDLLDTRAVVYLASGQFDLAIRDVEASLTARPSAEKLFHAAQAYQGANRGKDAVDALRRAKSMGLSPETLHPLERKAYQQLLNATTP